MNIAIGTAQFGLNYGVSNQTGQVTNTAAAQILHFAQKVGITSIDTALAYGNSQEVIGYAHKQLHEPFHIITKLSVDNISTKQVVEQVQDSLSLLHCNQLDAILLHQADELLNERKAENYQKLSVLKAFGLCKKIGVSFYHPEQFIQLAPEIKLDLIQVPMSILDQRFLTPEVQKKVNNERIEVHARSLFLQGLLLMQINQLPAYFKPFKLQLDLFHQMLKREQLTALQACLSFAKSTDFVDKFVIGVNQLSELEQIVLEYSDINKRQFTELASTELGLVNPALWQL